MNDDLYAAWKWRGGRLAVYRGHAYRFGGSEAVAPLITLIPEQNGTVPDGLEPRVTAGGASVYLVHPEQLDEWFAWHWTFTWRGEPFEVQGAAGEDALYGRYAGRNGSWALAQGLEQVDKYEVVGTFPRAEVADLTEHREDLLARWKEEHAR
jgi:hypothetical protein